jgi:hypothetical protein
MEFENGNHYQRYPDNKKRQQIDDPRERRGCAPQPEKRNVDKRRSDRFGENEG